jgi:hypothetical protein
MSKPTEQQTLDQIYKAVGDWMPPVSELSDRDVLVVITELLERHGYKFVADDAFSIPEDT